MTIKWLEVLGRKKEKMLYNVNEIIAKNFKDLWWDFKMKIDHIWS